MLDIKYIRENTESVKQRLATRGTDYSALVDKAVALDGARRALIADNEEQKARQNAKNKEIPALKKAGQDVSAVFEELKEIARRIKEDDARQAELEKELEDVLLAIPNLPNERVPVGRDDSENLEMRRSGEPTQFPFEPKAHWDIGRDLGILDPETAAKVSGARFHFYKGLGARLERAVINFFLNTHTGEHGYTEVFPPFMVNRDSMRGTGQLPKFEEDAFRVANNDYFLIPTAEGPVIQGANLRALRGGVTTDGIFALVRELRRDVAVPMVFMTYANVVFSYGTQRFLSACSEAGIDGLILPDLPFEEKEEFLPDCRRYGVALISLIAPTSENRIAMIAREAEGFVYLVSSLGVTGTRSEITTDLAAIVRVIRENTSVPCAIGFGISTPEQARRMAALSDGAIVGSAIVRLVETYGKDSPPHVGEYVKQMKNAMLTG